METPNILKPPENWDISELGKKIAYTLAKWKAAMASGIGISPFISQIVEHLNADIQPWGITVHVNVPVFEKILPVLIFSGLITGHDYLKAKYPDKKWL